ncbi:hypothetical protein ACQ86N_21330 [Puia sp. P3]|uniref:hypothetical protein n=1 Tax=Puia sp. P3 TaxID=3423952 RepID=UPI003D67AD88
MLKSRLVLLLALSFLQSAAQDLLTKEWKASWITTPGSSHEGYGVYLFRRLIDLSTSPSSLPVCVSADNRYKLYVNDSLVSIGPARGDVQHWNYAKVDLAPSCTKEPTASPRRYGTKGRKGRKPRSPSAPDSFSRPPARKAGH